MSDEHEVVKAFSEMADIHAYNKEGPGIVRVIYNETRVPSYAKNPAFNELVVRANKVDTNFLRNLYRDPIISELSFFSQLYKKNHRFNKEEAVLYFYKLKDHDK